MLAYGGGPLEEDAGDGGLEGQVVGGDKLEGEVVVGD